MDRGRWKDVERVIDVALASDPGDWPSILDRHCGHDPALRQEVAALLARYGTAQRYLVEPPSAAAAALTANAQRVTHVSIESGVRLAERYEIVRELGQGGMATVYLARDERHGRDVAIKILTPDLMNAVRRSRFVREIEIAAGLTHPHILPVHDSGEADGLLFYVMPFVDGETLRARLARDPSVSAGDAMVILRDVADALAYAHARGVVHRDVKPENIMLSGRHALVADFGIAKALREATADRETITGAGVWLGTPAYMAPEQALGDPAIDHRADIYSLGVVAYEMLTGRLPFGGRTPQEQIVAHVAGAAEPLDQYRDDLPPALVTFVMTCLAKHPDERWQNADLMLQHLDALRRPSATIGRRVAVASVVTVVVLVALVAIVTRRDASVSPAALVGAGRQLTFTGDVRQAALSPNGRYLAVVRESDSGSYAYLRALAEAGENAVAIGAGRRVNEVVWAADGAELLLRTLDSAGVFAGYMRASVVGGTMPLLTVPRWHQRLSPDGATVATWSVGRKVIRIYSLTAADSLLVDVPGEYDWLMHAAWSPDSKNMVVLVDTRDHQSRLLIVDPANRRPPREVLRDSVQLITPVWGAQGDAIYYLRQRTGLMDLWKLPVSSRTGQPTRAPVLLLPALEVTLTQPGDGAYLDAFSVSSDGRRLMYVRDRTRSNIVHLRVDAGRRSYVEVRDLTAGTSIKGAAALSPNGDRIAFTDGDRTTRDVFVMPLAGGTPTRVTATGNAGYPVAWSPGGDRIAFVSRQAGYNTVAWVDAAGRATRVYADTRVGHELNTLTWHPGAHILYQEAGNRNWHRVVAATGIATPLIDAPVGWIFDATVARDTTTIAFRWNRQPPGIWLYTPATKEARLLIEGPGMYLLGWERDDRVLRVLDETTGRVLRVTSSGRRIGNAPALPAGCLERPAAIGFRPSTIDFAHVVCTRITRESDVWMVDDFDPEVPRRD